VVAYVYVTVITLTDLSTEASSEDFKRCGERHRQGTLVILVLALAWVNLWRRCVRSGARPVGLAVDVLLQLVRGLTLTEGESRGEGTEEKNWEILRI
jgi:hypothetical protein